MTSPIPYKAGARVGIIGLGSMGAGMARCLLAKGFPLQVFARRSEAAQAFVDAGAHVAASLAEVMNAFCKTVTHVGDSGAGQTVKACNQVAVAGALMGVADAIALAKAQGLDPALMREVLMGGTAKSFPLEKHAPRIIGNSFTPGFRARLMRKDLRLALDTARAVGATLPTVTVAEQLLDAMCRGGRADWDWCAVALEVQRLSGVEIPDTPEPS